MDIPDILEGEVELAGQKVPKVLLIVVAVLVMVLLVKVGGKKSTGEKGGESPSNTFGGNVLQSSIGEVSSRLTTEQTRNYNNLSDLFKQNLAKLMEANAKQSQEILDKVDKLKLIDNRPSVNNMPVDDKPRGVLTPSKPGSWAEWFAAQSTDYKKWYKGISEREQAVVRATLRQAKAFEKPKEDKTNALVRQ